MLLLGVTSSPAQGQGTAGEWYQPRNISNSTTESVDASIAVDPSGVVHVVWVEVLATAQGAIFYSYRTGSTWSQPVDILQSPDGRPPASPALVADSRGYLHIVYLAAGSVYYSRAYAPAAHSANGWEEPYALTLRNNDSNVPRLILDERDILHIVYSIQAGGEGGIYYVRSEDGGEIWQNVQPVYVNTRADRLVDKASLAVGSDGRLYAVWVEYENSEKYPRLGIRYASSLDDGKNWSTPAAIANGPYDHVNVAARTAREVHIVWSGTSPDRFEFHCWSSDGGQTWSEVWRNTELGGFLGSSALVVDGNDILHLIQPGDMGTETVLYYSFWQGRSWSPGVVLMQDPKEGANHLGDVAATVGLGNELAVVLLYPPDETQHDIFYLHRHLDARGQRAQALPTITPQPSPTATVVPVAEPTATATPATLPTTTMGNNPGLTTSAARWQAIVIGVLSAGILVSATTIYLSWVHRRRGR